jgi:hypothetical protein
MSSMVIRKTLGSPERRLLSILIAADPAFLQVADQPIKVALVVLTYG